MSLINEALKRAKETQNQQQTQPKAKKSRASEPAMRPVEAKAQPTSPVVYILSAALVVVLLGAMVLLWAWNKSNQTVVANNNSIAVDAKPEPVVIAAAVPAKNETVPVAVPVVTPAPQPVAPVQTTEPVKTESAESNVLVATEPVSIPAPEPVAPAIPQFPTLKLQGIFYNPVNPAAVVNGKTYSIGGVVSGARITKIEPERITVEWNGETRDIETAQ